MTASLVDGQRVEIRGFGSFKINYRPLRIGRNPNSGENVTVPENYVPHFKAGSELRQRVDSWAEALANGRLPARLGIHPIGHELPLRYP